MGAHHKESAYQSNRPTSARSGDEKKEGIARFKEAFRHFARGAAFVLGTQWAFMGAVVIIIVWAAVGPLAKYSDTWQLVINTGTTIVTFLMVFLIQNTQNRDGRAIQLKLDELLAAVSHARTGMVDLEECSDEELDKLENEFRRIREKHKDKPEIRDHDPEDENDAPQDGAGAPVS